MDKMVLNDRGCAAPILELRSDSFRHSRTDTAVLQSDVVH
jgi:hypothetical protein